MGSAKAVEDIIREYTYEKKMSIAVWPLGTWTTSDIVQLIQLLDAELQRRHGDG